MPRPARPVGHCHALGADPAHGPAPPGLRCPHPPKKSWGALRAAPGYSLWRLQRPERQRPALENPDPPSNLRPSKKEPGRFFQRGGLGWLCGSSPPRWKNSRPPFICQAADGFFCGGGNAPSGRGRSDNASRQSLPAWSCQASACAYVILGEWALTPPGNRPSKAKGFQFNTLMVSMLRRPAPSSRLGWHRVPAEFPPRRVPAPREHLV